VVALLVPVIALLILIIVALLAIAVLVLLYRERAEPASSSRSSPAPALSAPALPELTEVAHTKADDPIAASQPIIAISVNGNADSAAQPVSNRAPEIGKPDHLPTAGIPAQTEEVELSTVTHTDSSPPVAEEQTGVFALIGLPHIPI
jgi:hypothetical protein